MAKQSGLPFGFVLARGIERMSGVNELYPGANFTGY